MNAENFNSAVGNATHAESDRLLTEIAERESRISRLQKDRWRSFPLGIFVALVVIAIIIVYRNGHPKGLSREDIETFFTDLSKNDPFPVIMLCVTIVVAPLYLLFSTASENDAAADIELLQAKQRIAARLPTEAGQTPSGQPAPYFDSLVKINIDNLSEYYSLVKIHTNKSFWASLIAAFAGFSFILIGVILGFGGTQTDTPAKLAAVSGIIIEFMSGVFFYLYSKTVRQLKDYHDSLLSVQNVLLSLKLVNDTQDLTARAALIQQTCQVLLAGVNPPIGATKAEVTKGILSKRSVAPDHGEPG